MNNIKQSISNLEILGAEVLLNKVLTNEYGYDRDTELLFYCERVLNSTDMANGYPIIIERYELSYCVVLENGMLVAVCVDDTEGENEHFFRVEEYSGFVELNQ